MLKKIIIGLVSLLALAVIGAGAYIYTVDWNKHKSLVAQRLSQISGLNAIIDGQLSVELFPSPKFSVGLVKFYKSGNNRDPLISISQISSNMELKPLLDNKFVLSSMTLVQPTIYLDISEKGDFNWSGFGISGKNKSGNIEVSFNDVRVTNAVLRYNNSQSKKAFQLQNISANISAPTLQGPYKTSGMLIHNNSEIKFSGDVVKNDALAVKMLVENAQTNAKIFVDGTLGNKAKGNLTFETKSFTDTAAVVFGNGMVNDVYKEPLYFSFKYDCDNDLTKLENFTVKYGQHSIGTGNAVIKNMEPHREIAASFDMTQFDVNFIGNIIRDYVHMMRDGTKFSDMALSNYDGNLSIKAEKAFLNNTEAQNLNLGIKLKDGVLDVTRLGIVMAGDTSLKAVGKINLNNGMDYQFNQIVESKDLRTFASIFGIDLAKLANPEQKKSIFKRAQAEIAINGNLDSLKVSILKGGIDATSFKGNFGCVKKDKERYVLADINASQILFDKYLVALPKDKEISNLEDKVLYQLNLIPLDKDLNLDVNVTIDSAVYNEVPIEKMHLQFALSKENLVVKKFSAANLGGGVVNMSFDADKIYSKPYFKELTFDVKTNNFPVFSSALGIKNLTKPLFKRKLFAVHGALSGTFANFSLSSVQKFGETEFSYTGTVENVNEVSVNGDLELKSSNFSNFIKALNLDYTPDIPLTSFALKSKIRGTNEIFAIDDVSAYLGANNIRGRFDFDNSEMTPKIMGQFDFDKFDADRLFNLNKADSHIADAKQPAAFIAPLVFSEKKIDYSNLKKVDFNLAVTAKQLVYKNKSYANAKTSVLLKDGVLKVDNLSFSKDEMSIALNLILDSNNIAKAKGSFDVKGIQLSELGGNVYMIEGGSLSTEGNFDSLATSAKDFIENLNAKGKFDLLQTTVKGWDLDIIKFEFEQRKTIEGFEEAVMNSLKTGHSAFTRIYGDYEVTKGLLVSENTLLESPVADLNMKLDLNLNNWLLNAVFNGIYRNATFPDVLKFSYAGNIANPQLKLDLSESIKRVRDTEKMLDEVKNSQEKAQKEKLEERKNLLNKELDNELQNISRITLDILRFKPVSVNENVTKVYNQSIKTLQDSEAKLKLMANTLKANPNGETLLNLETELEIEKSKIKFIPKTLEDNFIVDSKYIFDDAFNKITWVYNVAQNNASYYSGLTDVYMEQVGILADTDTPVSEAKQKFLQDGIDSVNDDIKRINGLYDKIRNNYLNVIDSQKISEMKKNNETAKHALDTIFGYTERMNDAIVDSIENFRTVLDIKARDYDEYIVYLPKSVDNIDAAKSTIGSKQPKKETSENDKSSNKKQTNTSLTVSEKDVSIKQAEETKKKDDILSLDLNSVKSGIFGLIKKIKVDSPEETEIKVAQHEVVPSAETATNNENHKMVKPDVVPAVEVGLKKVVQPYKEEVESVSAEKMEQSSQQKNKDITESKPTQQEEIFVAQTIKTPLPPVVEKKTIPESNAKIEKPVLALQEEKNEIKTAKQILPVVADNKDTLSAVDEKTQQTLLSSGTQTAVVQTAEVQTVLPVRSETSQETLLENTKSAMGDIMAKIKQTESNFKSLFIENDKNLKDKVLAYKQQFPTFKKEFSGNFFGKTGETQSGFFKTNPVVALGIGKDENPLIDAEISNSLNRKKGFSRSRNIPAIALTDESFAFHIASKENTLQSPLIKLLSDERLDDDFSVKLSDLTDDVPVYIETPEEESEPETNVYVFSITDNRTLPFSGESNKSFLKSKKNSNVRFEDKSRYLFAQNLVSPRFFSGEVSKNRTLYVK